MIWAKFTLLSRYSIHELGIKGTWPSPGSCVRISSSVLSASAAMEGTTMTTSNVINSPKVTNTAIIDKIRLLKRNLYWKNFTNGCII